MTLSKRQFHNKKRAKLERRSKRKEKIAAKKAAYITTYEPAVSKGSFNKSAWNNTITKKRENEVLEKRKIGFDKQAWLNG